MEERGGLPSKDGFSEEHEVPGGLGKYSSGKVGEATTPLDLGSIAKEGCSLTSTDR